MVRLLLKRSGDTYTLAKAWIDGQLDVDTTLNASASCEGLYCLKTDERMNSGAGSGSSFGSLRSLADGRGSAQAMYHGGGRQSGF